MTANRSYRHIFLSVALAAILVFAAACSNVTKQVDAPVSSLEIVKDESTASSGGGQPNHALLQEAPSCPSYLTEEECGSLNSLTLIDDHPLYTMHYFGEYDEVTAALERTHSGQSSPVSALQWGCSLFAAFADYENPIYGRNFDWRFSPALILFTDPDDGYASVTMVDYDYLGFTGSEDLAALPIEKKLRLLQAPFLPFDGMNEHGLAIGMAAVPPGQATSDPTRETIDSLRIIREMLDHARDVPEAVHLFEQYNIEMGAGPPLHYLIADASGQSTLLEFFQGELVALENDRPWQIATNFLRSPVKEHPQGQCWRNDRIEAYMVANKGEVSVSEGLALLEDVSQANTQWSIIYDIGELEIAVAIGKDYGNIYNFQLEEP